MTPSPTNRSPISDREWIRRGAAGLENVDLFVLSFSNRQTILDRQSAARLVIKALKPWVIASSLTLVSSCSFLL
jgi:hypothetical protein